LDTETNGLALRTALNEIKNTCPGISNIFVLNENKQVLAQDQNTPEELINGIADVLTPLIERAATVGGIESLTYQGVTQRINFNHCDNNYFVTVASNETDEKAMTNLTRVLVPTFLKLAQEGVFSHEKNVAATPKLKTPKQTTPKLATPDLPASEFVVEPLSGLSIISSSPETIRLDRALIGEWKELYGNKKIEEAIVEEVTEGKRMRCTFEPIKGSKLEGQGVVQIPNRVQTILGIKKGAVVLVRPVVETEAKKHD
jgi:hypothetical protein